MQTRLKCFARCTCVNMKKSFLPSNKRPFALTLDAMAAECIAEDLDFICISSVRRRVSSHFCLQELGNVTADVYYVKHPHRALITNRETIFSVSLSVFLTFLEKYLLNILKH